ncbi:MAG TPA: zinc-binding alcohol dehydrogenase family protein [Polyangiaceae bacterium]|nr:zinc-binding alcohol dehydrogenase family protein [Polyangiaceae bacterium]
MKAAVVRDFAAAPRYETHPEPAAGGAGVPVTVLAAALSPRVRSGAAGRHYTSSGALPLVPGLDGVGTLADGRRVYFLAENERLGTMAERTLAEPSLTVDVPDGLDAPAVAALMLPAISSWVALTQRVHLERGESVLVLGATGTSGQLAVQIAKHLGASQIVAAGRNEAGLERARAFGAQRVVRLSGTDADGRAVAEAASEVDVVLDYLWGTVTSAVLPTLGRARAAESRALRWVLVGSAAGDEIALSSVLLRKRNLQVLGSGQGAVPTEAMFGAAPEVLRALAAGKLTVNARAVSLSEVERFWSAPLDAGERLVFTP